MFRAAGIEDEVREQSEQEFEPEGALIIMDSLLGQEARRHHPEPERRRRCAQPVPAAVHQPAGPRADPAQARAIEAGAQGAGRARGGRRRAGRRRRHRRPSGTSTAASERTLRGKYLVGADGAHSKVRELLGIPFDGRGVFSNSMTIYFQADVAPQLLRQAAERDLHQQPDARRLLPHRRRTASPASSP